MSTKSISPFPIQDSSGVVPSEGQSSNLTPDLSALRRSWSTRFQDLPSFPDATPEAATGSRRNPAVGSTASRLPELPALGELASKAVLAMEGHDELFGQQMTGFCDQGGEAFPRVDDSVHFSSPRRSASQPSPLNIPHIPEMALPAADEQPLGASSPGKIEQLTAMPTMEVPSDSIPLARDRFMPPVETPASTPVPKPTAVVETVIPPRSPEIESPIVSQDPEPFAETPDQPLDPPSSVPSDDTVSHDSADAPDTVRLVAPETTADSEYTDEDLRNALHPIIAPCVDKFLYTPTHGIHTYLEPMLRSTVRRAIAEQMEDASPFREVSGWDKFAWKMRAAFSSRTYEDIVFNHTKRYQVEEAFLLRPLTRSLISYASHDPSRHASPSKVQGTVKKIATKVGDKNNADESCINWEGTRNLMVRRGAHCILVAIVHGPSNAILRADLDYALRQAEERFGKTLEEESDIHLQILQPLLEGCLLIQAPAIPN